MNIVTIVGAIAACIAAFVAVLTLRDSKRCVLKRIEKKQEKLRAIENARLSQVKIIPTQITSLDVKREKLQSEIEKLKHLL